MFTGLIEGLGTITAIRPAGRGKRVAVTAEFDLDRTRIGDSIAVNGACVTVTAISQRRFEVDMSPETIARTTFKAARPGERVNLERAMRLSDRLDGHLVAGHIDGVGVIDAKQPIDDGFTVSVQVPPDLAEYLIDKGSVAVDGISLTVNACRPGGFDVWIIPHTGQVTTIGFKPVGAEVNIETDMIGKYVARFVRGSDQPMGGQKTDEPSGIDKALLQKMGFMS